MSNAPLIETVDELLKKFGSKITYTSSSITDSGAFYAPYMPLTTSGSLLHSLPPGHTEIKQIYDHLTYMFHTEYNTNDHIINWLINECNWNYTLFSYENKDSGFYETYVMFKDVKGSIEFKLRFVS